MVVQSLFNLKSLPLVIAASAALHHTHQSDSGTGNLYVASSWNAVSCQHVNVDLVRLHKQGIQ